MLATVGMKLNRHSFIEPTAIIYSGNLEIGSGSYANNLFMIDGLGHCRIGSGVRNGPSVKLLTATHEITNIGTARASYDVKNLPIEIEDGVWIGAGVTIMGGCVVRTGCVIGANALITRSTEPNGLYLGSPARRVRDLEVGESAIMTVGGE
jgi:maltose O-acetyltransferase